MFSQNRIVLALAAIVLMAITATQAFNLGVNKKVDVPLAPVDYHFKRAVDNDRVLQFRQTYRSFRTGKALGAKGEIDQFHVESEIENFPENQSGIEHETFSNMGHSHSDEIYSAVTNYRLSYAKFRQGNSRGAKGEVSAVADVMTLEHARSMPVAQQSQFLRLEQDSEPQDTKLHVHFGGGRLGLSLLSPAVSEAHKLGIPYVIVDAPFGDYAELVKRGHDTVNFYVNGVPTLTDVKLVTREDQLPKNLFDPNTRIFICSTDQNLVSKVLKYAETVSTSLGPIMPKVIAPYFTEPSGKYIYCCENDHGMVEKMEESLRNIATVVTCMVDRISIDRKVEGNNIYAISEPYAGEIVVLHPPKGAILPAFKGMTVKVPSSKAAAEYFCRRKIGVVNGMHTTLAFISLLEKCKGDTAEDVDLLSPSKATKEQQEMIRDFMVARLLLILYEHDTSVIKRAHNVSTEQEVAEILLDYGESTLKRYDTIEDKTSRVLGGGVANRWSTRLCNVKRFFDANKSLDSVSKRLIRLAGVNEKRMRANVNKLVSESERFVGQKPTWEGAK